MTPLALYRRITSFLRYINIMLAEISLVIEFREDYVIAGFCTGTVRSNQVRISLIILESINVYLYLMRKFLFESPAEREIL